MIYHRHRRGHPYHLSEMRLASAEKERKKRLNKRDSDLEMESERGATNYADSPNTFGMGDEDAYEVHSRRELDNSTEIRELDTEEKPHLSDRVRRVVWIEGKPRELEGDGCQVELSATKSGRTKRKGSEGREKPVELEGSQEWPEKTEVRNK